MSYDTHLKPHLHFPVAFACRGWTTFEQRKVAFRFGSPGQVAGCYDDWYLRSGSLDRTLIVNNVLALACPDHTDHKRSYLPLATRLIADLEVILAPWEPEFTLLNVNVSGFSWLHYTESLPTWTGKTRSGSCEVFPLHVSFGKGYGKHPVSQQQATLARETFLRWFAGRPVCPLRHQYP